MSNRSPRQQAQSIVEFGIIAIVFAFLIMGIYDFGMLLNAWMSVGNASASVARQAAVGSNPYQLSQMAQGIRIPGNAGAPALNVEVRIQCPTGCQVTGTETWAAVDWSQVTQGQTGYSFLSPYNGGWKYPNGAQMAGSAPPVQGDLLRVTISAPRFAVLTPVVSQALNYAHLCYRPAGVTDNLCYVWLTSPTYVRYEGGFVS